MMGIVIAAIALTVAALLFADELVRTFWRRRIESVVALPPGCEVRQGRRLCYAIGRISGLRHGAGGITFGRTIVVADREPSARLLRHERGHCIQRVRDGRLYLPKYIGLWVVSAARHRSFSAGYRQHPYEIEARGQEHLP